VVWRSVDLKTRDGVVGRCVIVLGSAAVFGPRGEFCDVSQHSLWMDSPPAGGLKPRDMPRGRCGDGSHPVMTKPKGGGEV
jgi:hypothetical protein